MISTKIRVLVTVPHLTSSGSPYREMIALAKYLPRDEFSLVICSLRKNGIEETGPFLNYIGIRFFIAKFRIKKIKNIPDFFKANQIIAENGPFDIQHSFDFSTVPLEAISARFHGRKFIHQQTNYNIGGHYSALWIKFLFSNKVIACSPGIREFLNSFKLPTEKISLVRYGIEIDEINFKNSMNTNTIIQKKNVDQEIPIILMVSNIVPLKRIEDGLKAISKILPEYPNLKLIIIGAVFNKEYHMSLMKIVEENKLQNNVEFTGQQSNQEVLEKMEKSHIMIHCAENEAFGWVILEAFSKMLPVIAAESDGPKDIVSDGVTGYLYPIGDTEKLAEKLVILLRNPALRDTIAKKSYQNLKENFSAELMVSQIAQVYRDLVFHKTR